MAAESAARLVGRGCEDANETPGSPSSHSASHHTWQGVFLDGKEINSARRQRVMHQTSVVSPPSFVVAPSSASEVSPRVVLELPASSPIQRLFFWGMANRCARHARIRVVFIEQLYRWADRWCKKQASTRTRRDDPVNVMMPARLSFLYLDRCSSRFNGAGPGPNTG